MDRKMARTNIRCGSAMFVMLLVLLGVSVTWAVTYLNYVVGK